MPGARAKQLCPHGIFIRGNMQMYSENSRLVTQIIEDAAPLVETKSRAQISHPQIHPLVQ